MTTEQLNKGNELTRTLHNYQDILAYLVNCKPNRLYRTKYFINAFNNSDKEGVYLTPGMINAIKQHCIEQIEHLKKELEEL